MRVNVLRMVMILGAAMVCGGASGAPAVPGAVPGAGGAVERPREAVHESVFHRALRAMMTEEAPEAVRVGDEQRSEIAAIDRERMEEQRAFMRDHADELRALRVAIAGANEAGDREEVARLMRRLREIESARPGAENYERRVWGVLNDAQRAHMRETIIESAYAALQRRMVARLDALRGEGSRALDGAQRPAGGRGGVTLTDTELERVRAALRAPPTESERAMGSVERARSRVLGLPDEVLSRQRRAAVAERLLEGEAGA